MKIHLALVSESNRVFLNQVKLLLFSFRKNAGKLKDIPVTLITNAKSLDDTEIKFFKKHFSPIDFKTMPKLGAIPHTSKLNAFYAIDPSEYDVLMFMDCDTVVLRSLDNILDPIIKKHVQFLCRRGGETDRNRFINFENLVKEHCQINNAKKITFEGEKEFPMFNSGVFLATSDAVKKIRKNSIQITYDLYEHFKKRQIIESTPLFKKLFRLKLLKSKKQVLQDWPIEQGGLALSCIKAGIKVGYLDEKYNSWGNLKDIKILHCFKSAYKFDRRKMFSSEADKWIKKYEKSDLPGKMLLASIIKECKKEIIPKEEKDFDTKHVFGKENIEYGINEAIVLCLVRDGETWISDFIEHYQKLGFKHIVFIDNGSNDKTIDIAKRYKNITILETDIPFKGNNILLRRYLVDRFAKNNWSLTVDIDELWNYPYSDKLPLPKFLEYLRLQGANAVVGQMLDMFMEKIPEKRQPLVSYNLYDISDLEILPLECMVPHGLRYKKILNKDVLFLRSGIRKTIFGMGGVWLTKMPLLFNNSNLKPLTHQHFSNGVVVADISTVLLHYKFTEKFKEQTNNALKERQYLCNSLDYKNYARVLSENPSLKIQTKSMQKLNDINQLINDNFIVVSVKYKKWVNKVIKNDE